MDTTNWSATVFAVISDIDAYSRKIPALNVLSSNSNLKIIVFIMLCNAMKGNNQNHYTR